MRGMRTYYYQIESDENVYKFIASIRKEKAKKFLPDTAVVWYVEPTKGNFEILWQKAS
jgi:hypothetical protein